ncbi:MAG: class I SAM-dependent methyltransferase [Candidatus Oleimicrobiaceae bacterium]
MMLRKRLRLLPEELLVKTGRVDHADWNYRPLLGFVQRQRFRLCERLLGPFALGAVLEVGYGSGVFLPELGTYARWLFGIDVHPFGAVVRAALSTQNVGAHLVRASAEALPFADGSFDLLVAVSALEFVPDLARGCAEMHRVLKNSGRLIVITPGASPVVDFGFKILTGEDAKRDFGKSRQRIRAALEQHFLVERELRFPPLCPRALCLYRALRLRPRASAVPATNALPCEEEAFGDVQHSVASICEQEVEE